MYNTVWKITAAYFLIQSWLFYEVCSTPVKVNQQWLESQRLEGQGLSGQMDESEPEKSFSALSTTFPPQRQGEAKSGTTKSVVVRLKRKSSPCVLKKTVKWNDCLGRFNIKLQCRSQSVGCLSANNNPPKCQKNYQAIPGQNGYCQVLKSCTCAA